MCDDQVSLYVTECFTSYQGLYMCTHIRVIDCSQCFSTALGILIQNGKSEAKTLC